MDYKKGGYCKSGVDIKVFLKRKRGQSHKFNYNTNSPKLFRN